MTKKHVPKQTNTYNETEDLQQKFVQLQVMKQQAQSFLEEKQKVDAAVSEMSMTLDAMEKLKHAKNDDEIWPNLGSGAFIKGKMTDTDAVMVGVGAGIVVKKNIGAAITIMEKRVEDMKSVDGELINELNKLMSGIQSLEPEVEKMAEKLQKEGKM